MIYAVTSLTNLWWDSQVSRFAILMPAQMTEATELFFYCPWLFGDVQNIIIFYCLTWKMFHSDF